MTRDLRRMAVGHDPGFLRDRLEQAEGGLLLAERGGHPGWGADPRRPRGRGRGPGPWAVAGAFVGTVVGAGFASGQETLRVFTAFGPAGLAGRGLAGPGCSRWAPGWAPRRSGLWFATRWARKRAPRWTCSLPRCCWPAPPRWRRARPPPWPSSSAGPAGWAPG